jgi:CBS domain-containing protein
MCYQLIENNDMMSLFQAIFRDRHCLNTGLDSIKSLPICDHEGRPVGIVTRTDLVGAMCGR